MLRIKNIVIIKDLREVGIFLIFSTLGFILFFLIMRLFLLFLVLFPIIDKIIVGAKMPNPAFLSDIAAFEAAIIAFLVPMSIEIVSKISERYESDVISRSFDNNWKNRLLPPFLMANIVLAITLRFLVQDNTESTLWVVLAWTILAALVFAAFVIWRVILDIKKYMGSTRTVIDHLFYDIKKALDE